MNLAQRVPALSALLIALTACAPAKPRPTAAFHEGSTHAADCVVFLHGLIRSSASMDKAVEAFRARGYSLSVVDFIPSPDDGKVSVASTKVEGMADFVAVPHSHPFVAQSPDVIEHAISFIETGRFVHAAP